MAVTRSDVARAAGVSPAVVSYVINNGPRPVSTGMRIRVELAIADLGYRPNTIASALRGGSSRSIGLLTPGLGSPQHAEFAEALEKQLASSDYLMITGSTGHDRAQERRQLRMFVERRVDALVFAPGMTVSTRAITGIDDIPVLIVDDLPFRADASGIRIEDSLDATYAVQHLQSHGHSLIGCICGPGNRRSGEGPALGWRQAQQAARAPNGQELVAHAEDSEAGGYAAALQLLSGHGRVSNVHRRVPTALFVASDTQAIGAISACYELGLRFPEDIAVVSLGGTRLASYFNPPITSMRRDTDLIAQVAIEHLLARIKNPSVPPVHVALRGNLVVGHSCGC